MHIANEIERLQCNIYKSYATCILVGNYYGDCMVSFLFGLYENKNLIVHSRDSTWEFYLFIKMHIKCIKC